MELLGPGGGEDADVVVDVGDEFTEEVELRDQGAQEHALGGSEFERQRIAERVSARGSRKGWGGTWLGVAKAN